MQDCFLYRVCHWVRCCDLGVGSLPQATIDGLRGLNNMVAGTGLPRLDANEIETMIYRDSLAGLGLA